MKSDKYQLDPKKLNDAINQTWIMIFKIEPLKNYQ